MPDYNERPVLKFLISHEKFYEDMWAPARSNWRDTDKYHQGNFDIWTNGAHANTRGQYRPPTARTIIDHTADQFTALIPTVHREPMNDSDTARVAADNIEVAVKAVLMDAALHSMANPWRLLGKHFNAYGYGVKEIDLVGIAPALKATRPRPSYWNPVRMEAVNPGRVLLDPLEKIPNSAIKICQMTAQAVADLVKSKKGLKYVEPFDMGDRDPWELMTIVRQWTGANGWLTVREAGGSILYQQKNTWGFVPFAHAFAGYGMEPSSLDGNDPKYMAQGLLDPIKGALRIQAQSHTAKHTMVIEQAYAPYGTSADREEFVKGIDQGGVIQGQEFDYWKLKIQDVPRWVFESGRETDETIERSVGASARGGLRQPGVDTIGQQAILNNQMRRKFMGPSIQQEHIASIEAGWILRLVDNLSTLKDGIGAHGKRVSRADIGGNYDISVTFDPLDPVMEAQRRGMLREDYVLGLLDDEGYWTQTGVQNITQRREALNRQRVRNSLAVIARTAKVTAEAMDELDQEDIEAVTQEAAAGALPLVGTPGAQPAEQRQPLDDQTFKPQRLDNVGLE